MRTANNNFTVEALVAKYRKFVKEHCPKTLACYPVKGNFVEEEVPNEHGSMESLILSLYTAAAGDKANKFVLKALDGYSHIIQDNYKDAFSDEEYSFLVDNFSSFMDNAISIYPFSEVLSKPSRTALIPKYLSPQKGETIFIANTGFDMPCLFPYCNYKGYFDTEENTERWAFGQIFLFAKGIQSEIDTCEFDEGIGYKTQLPEKNSMEYIVYGAHEDTTYNDILSLYETLAPNGRMLVFVNKSDMRGRDDCYRELRKRLVDDRAITTIVSYCDNESLTGIDAIRILLVIDKKENVATKILSLPLNKEMELKSSKLNPTCLWPGFYFAIKPENGIALSCLASCPSRKDDIRLFKELLGGKPQWEEVGNDVRLVLPEWMLNLSVAIASDLSSEYKDAYLCNKDLLHVSDPSLDHWRSRMRVVENPCVLLAITGDTTRKLSLGFFDNVTERKFARTKGMSCLFPKKGIDVKYLAAILLLPVVREQIFAISEGSLYGTDFGQMLDLVIVPDYDEKERLKFLVETSSHAISDLHIEKEKEIEEKLSVMKADYINEVRMRKHDMRPHLRQLASCKRLMGYYIENARSIDDLKKNLRNQLEYSHVALDSLSAIVDHLSDEEKFGTPEVVNIDELLAEIEYNHDESEGFAIEYGCDEDAFRNAGFAIPDFIEQWENAKEQGIDMVKFIQAKSKENLPLLVNIAPVDFQRLVTNIIENARKHGFTDNVRTDYYIGIDLTLDSEREMYQIDFSNNGNPLPKGMDKEHYGIRGVKAGTTGESGNGGYIIKSIVTHYGGDYDIFTKNGITTIRIYLPITRI